MQGLNVSLITFLYLMFKYSVFTYYQSFTSKMLVNIFLYNYIQLRSKKRSFTELDDVRITKHSSSLYVFTDIKFSVYLKYLETIKWIEPIIFGNCMEYNISLFFFNSSERFVSGIQNPILKNEIDEFIQLFDRDCKFIDSIKVHSYSELLNFLYNNEFLKTLGRYSTFRLGDIT